jgi:hypothetical protein
LQQVSQRFERFPDRHMQIFSLFLADDFFAGDEQIDTQIKNLTFEMLFMNKINHNTTVVDVIEPFAYFLIIAANVRLNAGCHWH